MDRTLELFKLFHYLKEVTTKSYSLKKLQDLIEKRIDKNTIVNEAEYKEYAEQFTEINIKLEKAIGDLVELIS